MRIAAGLEEMAIPSWSGHSGGRGSNLRCRGSRMRRRWRRRWDGLASQRRRLGLGTRSTMGESSSGVWAYGFFMGWMEWMAWM
ncbi:hypothetical protein M0R45_007117 [Rubus argutus]|uniref:Uncharacterized protein n=1 Tax=Rubus argutus TaxID=59490 RepID=A0AAW1YSF4_RUBAR